MTLTQEVLDFGHVQTGQCKVKEAVLSTFSAGGHCASVVGALASQCPPPIPVLYLMCPIAGDHCTTSQHQAGAM
jgi:hypothetical protein